MNYTSTVKLPLVLPRVELNDPNYITLHKERCDKEYNDLCRFINDIDKEQYKHLKYDKSYYRRISILFNKGRYIEFTCPSEEIWLFVLRSAKIKKFYDTRMIVCGKDRIEAVVRALNKKGYLVTLDLDWI